MKILTKQKKVLMSGCDHTARLSIPEFFAGFIDVATEHGDLMGVSSVDLAKLDLFWVVTKSKIKILRRPEMMQDYSISTWPNTPEILRSIRFCTFIDNTGVFAQAKTEWIMLKKQTFKPSKTTGIYPIGTDFCDNVAFDEPWVKFDNDFNDFDKEFSYKVKSTDIDFSNHMNNVNYIRALFSCLTTEQIEKADIKELEIHYKSQCFEGDNLKIRFKMTKEGFTVGFINNGAVAVAINAIASQFNIL